MLSIVVNYNANKYNLVLPIKVIVFPNTQNVQYMYTLWSNVAVGSTTTIAPVNTAAELL